MQEDVYQRGGLNLYAYCHNNPVMYYDPNGCYKVSAHGNSGTLTVLEDTIRILQKEGLFLMRKP